ncbi:MAG: GntR family transcriptional regulator [Rhodospirillaceae bacterium]|nr:GntR family transcriptional regulator [Rhodospirillaceae bacterium]
MHEITLQPPLIQQVYGAILDAINDGRLAPGERLTQESVAQRLNVSRQPVGQALILLKSQGFVCDAGRRGVMVAPLDADLVRSIYELRGAVDRLAAGLAARRAGPAAREEAEEILAAGIRAVERDDVNELVDAELAFHGFIYRLAGNVLIERTMALHWNHMRRVMGAVLTDPSQGRKVWREHRAIVDAIVAGDVEKAERLAATHVEDASGRLQEALKVKAPPDAAVIAS